MKIFGIIILLLGIVVSFQNCGETAANSNLLSQMDESLAQSSECSAEGCDQGAEFLWLQIREYNPYKIELATMNIGHFNVAGQCGTSTFSKHSFVWQLYEGFGQQQLVGQGAVDDRCVNGQFVVPIVPNEIAIVPDQRYTLNIELVGVDANNEEIVNPMRNSQGTLDVIFTTEAPH